MRRHEIFVVDKLSYDICDDMHTHMRHKTTSQQRKILSKNQMKINQRLKERVRVG